MQTTAMTAKTTMASAFGIAGGFIMGMSENAGVLEFTLGTLMAAMGLFPIVARMAATGVRAALISTGIGALIVGAGFLLGKLMEDSPEEKARKQREQQEKMFKDMEANMKRMREKFGVDAPGGAMGNINTKEPFSIDSGFNFVDPPSFHRGGTAKLKSGEIMMTSGPGTTDMSVLSQATVTALTSAKGNGGESKELAKEIALSLIHI